MTDPDGVTIQYQYDALKRRSATSVFYGGTANITTTNTLDALGRIVASQRIGTDGTRVTLALSQFDLLGNLVRQTNALGGATTITNVLVDGQRYITNTYPNGGTRIEAYYRDGRLQSVTGSAVHGVQYTYDVEQDPNTGYWREVTTETKLDATGNPTSEWTKTFTDGAGRGYITTYSAQTPPYPSEQSFYNNYGRLWKKVDPDGVVTLFTCYDNSGDINQSQPAYTIVAEDSNTRQISDYATLVNSLQAIQGGI